MDIADLLSARAGAFAGRFFGALDQTAVGDKVLDGGKAIDIVNLIEENQAENFADAMDRSLSDERSWNHAPWPF